MERHWKCKCGRSFWTSKGLEDHCRMKGVGHKVKIEQDRHVSTLEYLLEKSTNDATSDDEFSFVDDSIR